MKKDENFINGFLSAIELLKEQVVTEVGCQFYFQRINDGNSIAESIFEEFRKSFGAFKNHKGERRISADRVEKLLSNGIEFEEIHNWEIALPAEIDFWTDISLNQKIKNDYEMSVWKEKTNSLSIKLTQLLKEFFAPRDMKAYKYKGEIMNDLYYHWGGIHWLDILFSNEEENYLLHFDLED